LGSEPIICYHLTPSGGEPLKRGASNSAIFAEPNFP
jgi:hypothetical protein